MQILTTSSTTNEQNNALSQLVRHTVKRPVVGLHPVERFMKRAFDMTTAAIALLLVLPVLMGIAIVIKLDSPGPVFFMQERYGEKGRKFKMFKFRSMVNNADKMLEQVTQVDDDGTITYKNRNDFRVTAVGKFIRRSSLDELPQLLNVLRGEMSIVGPRPEVVKIVEQEYAPWQYERFNVPQGITGWWQVNGRSEMECYKATDQDIYYVRNYSFWLDIKIVLMTIPALLKSKGAF
jgi:exopolysaccharide biosynthesis polyprenyl glycosylphosphotransferase